MGHAWVNGSLAAEEEASIPIRDTGLLHGAGVFTTMRAYGGKVFRLDRHLERLRGSCGALSIPLAYEDEELTVAVGELLERNELSDARLRLTVTRGASRVDPTQGVILTPSVFMTAAALEAYPKEFYERGMTAIAMDEQKLNPYDIAAGHKTLNYFSRLAALRFANQQAAGEALWFNVHNYLQSGSISNVFIVKAGKLITPPTNEELQDAKLRESIPYARSAVLPGITRQTVVELAQDNGIEVQLTAIDVSQLLDADEVFVTNSIMQVMPVCRIERKAVGNDKPGPITMKLAGAYQEAVASA